MIAHSVAEGIWHRSYIGRWWCVYICAMNTHQYYYYSMFCLVQQKFIRNTIPVVKQKNIHLALAQYTSNIRWYAPQNAKISVLKYFLCILIIKLFSTLPGSCLDSKTKIWKRKVCTFSTQILLATFFHIYLQFVNAIIYFRKIILLQHYRHYFDLLSRISNLVSHSHSRKMKFITILEHTACVRAIQAENGRPDSFGVG